MTKNLNTILQQQPNKVYGMDKVKVCQSKITNPKLITY